MEEIEREIEQMRVSRGATLEGQDQADSALGWLRIEDAWAEAIWASMGRSSS